VDAVQVGSFVHPQKVPQMADTDELFRRLAAGPRPPVILSGLVLNEKGLERGLRCGVEMFCMGASASETHSLKNTGMGTAEATRRIVGAAREAVAADKRVQVSVQSAFGVDRRPGRRVAFSTWWAYLDAGLGTSTGHTAGHAHRPRSNGVLNHPASIRADAPATSRTTVWAWPACCRDARRGDVVRPPLPDWGCPFTKVAAGNVATGTSSTPHLRAADRRELGGWSVSPATWPLLRTGHAGARVRTGRSGEVTHERCIPPEFGPRPHERGRAFATLHLACWGPGSSRSRIRNGDLARKLGSYAG
jgi:hypothetical protein